MEPLELLSPARYNAHFPRIPAVEGAHRLVDNLPFAGLPSNELMPDLLAQSRAIPRRAAHASLIDLSTQRFLMRGFEYDSPLNNAVRSKTTVDDRQAVNLDRDTEEERTAKLQKFAGRWVVLKNNEVVSTGDNASEAAAGARARGIKVPYLLFVEPVSRDTAKMGL